MTHDELLAKLDSQIEISKTLGCDCISCDNAKALRAVVELHKPKEYKVKGTFTDGLTKTGCACGGWSYPCPTIQVIEKELSGGD